MTKPTNRVLTNSAPCLRPDRDETSKPYFSISSSPVWFPAGVRFPSWSRKCEENMRPGCSLMLRMSRGTIGSKIFYFYPIGFPEILRDTQSSALILSNCKGSLIWWSKRLQLSCVQVNASCASFVLWLPQRIWCEDFDILGGFCHSPVDFRAHSHAYPRPLQLTPAWTDARISMGEWQKP